MHNCRLTRRGLIDHVLDEMPPAEASQLLAELNDCAACREEYATLRNTWRLSGQALQSALPAENFWPGYHARLHGKLIALQEDNERASPSPQPVRQSLNSSLRLRFWIAAVTQAARGAQLAGPAGVLISLRSMGRKLATTSVRVPVPVVALALMLLFGVTVLALRSHGPLEAEEPAKSTQSNQLASVETRMVQVPVIQEKVVTRVVYVEKKTSESRGASHQLDREELNAANRFAGGGSDASRQMAMSLSGFKPTDQVKLTIIKGTYQDEK